MNMQYTFSAFAYVAGLDAMLRALEYATNTARQMAQPYCRVAEEVADSRELLEDTGTAAKPVGIVGTPSEP